MVFNDIMDTKGKINMVTDEELKECEKRNSKVIFEKIGKANPYEAINIAEKLGKYVGCKFKLPNYSIRLNNKIVELSHEFEKAGLSLFGRKYEHQTIFDISYAHMPITGEAVISDVIDKMKEASQELVDISNKLGEMNEKRNARITELVAINNNPITRLFTRIKNFFEKPKKELFGITNIDKEELENIVSKYKEKVEAITDYNLKDNFSDAIIKHFAISGYDSFVASEIMEEEVQPYLEKLELKELIPDIKENIKKLDDFEFTSQFDEYKSEFEKNLIKCLTKEFLEKYQSDDHLTNMDEKVEEEQNSRLAFLKKNKVDENYEQQNKKSKQIQEKIKDKITNNSKIDPKEK